MISGRGDPIRTGDLAVPNRARYQLRHAPTGIDYITKDTSGRPWRWLFPFSNKYDTIVEVRGLAQLVARALWEREVISSSLITPTTTKKSHEGSFFVVYIPGILNALGSL